MRRRDFVAGQMNVRARVRALETGAHPTVVLPGGFGRNTRWARLTVRPPASYVTDPGPPEVVSVVYRRVRADVLHFRTDGEGVDITAITAWPALLFQVGRSGWPARDKRFLTARGDGEGAVIRVTPTGQVYLDADPGGSGALLIDGSVPLG